MPKTQQTKDVISAVIENRPENGWIIIKYNILWAVLGLIGKIFYIILFGSMSYVLLFWESNNKDNLYYIMGSIFAFISMIVVFSLIKQIKNIFYWNTNMIVLTNNSIVKSIYGKIEEYPYSCIKELKIVRIAGNNMVYIVFPRSYIEFIDGRTNAAIDFTSSYVFGNVNKIYNLLLAKIS